MKKNYFVTLAYFGRDSVGCYCPRQSSPEAAISYARRALNSGVPWSWAVESITVY